MYVMSFMYKCRLLPDQKLKKRTPRKRNEKSKIKEEEKKQKQKNKKTFRLP